jgi:hypothetical protein
MAINWKMFFSQITRHRYKISCLKKPSHTSVTSPEFSLPPFLYQYRKVNLFSAQHNFPDRFLLVKFFFLFFIFSKYTTFVRSRSLFLDFIPSHTETDVSIFFCFRFVAKCDIMKLEIEHSKVEKQIDDWNREKK